MGSATMIANYPMAQCKMAELGLAIAPELERTLKVVEAAKSFDASRSWVLCEHDWEPVRKALPEIAALEAGK